MSVAGGSMPNIGSLSTTPFGSFERHAATICTDEIDRGRSARAPPRPTLRAAPRLRGAGVQRACTRAARAVRTVAEAVHLS